MSSITPNTMKRSRNNSKLYNPIVFDGYKPSQSIVSALLRKYGGTLERNSTHRQRSVVNGTFNSFDKEVSIYACLSFSELSYYVKSEM